MTQLGARSAGCGTVTTRSRVTATISVTRDPSVLGTPLSLRTSQEYLTSFSLWVRVYLIISVYSLSNLMIAARIIECPITIFFVTAFKYRRSFVCRSVVRRIIATPIGWIRPYVITSLRQTYLCLVIYASQVQVVELGTGFKISLLTDHGSSQLLDVSPEGKVAGTSSQYSVARVSLF